ncbi:TPA: methyltransferase domain-containing protein [Pseudomonas aeruginosa]|nr:methyltransferase domain-containing protein [Pseudomonas aeruginosa]HCF7399957.1 methyltransferase domain-containing protein [Pseudomonas aeruginosa]HCF7419138.1 methyltransferase domain-containing protein [Pseudomonas aeruginosa]
MIRALLQRWRSRPAAASEPVSPRMCGLRDAVLDGWFRSETGELLAGFAIGAQDTLLDLGCGEGVATLFAARQGASVIFTDSEEDKVRSLAQQVEAVARRPFTGLVSDSDPLPLRDACADKLVCMEVLEHVANPARVMAELVRLGRPGAQYLLSVPDPVGEHLQQGIAPADYFRAPNHIHIFSRDDFARLVQDAGLVIEHRQASGFFWVMGMIFFWASERAAGRELGGAVRDRIQPPYPALMEDWARLWENLLARPDGLEIKHLLDHFMPKSQVIIARKLLDPGSSRT